MLKSELRKLYLEKRRSLTTADVEELSRKICDGFFANTELAAVRTIHTFIPIPRFNEIDTWLIVNRIWRDYPQITTVTSVSGADPLQLEHSEFSAGSEFSTSSFGIKEPVGERNVAADVMDIILVPLLCIDRRGYRVGYGKGLYDRFLAKCRPDCLKIGHSFFDPVDSIDDIAAHDVPLDQCLTPDELIVFDR